MARHRDAPPRHLQGRLQSPARGDICGFPRDRPGPGLSLHKALHRAAAGKLHRARAGDHHVCSAGQRVDGLGLPLCAARGHLRHGRPRRPPPPLRRPEEPRYVRQASFAAFSRDGRRAAMQPVPRPRLQVADPSPCFWPRRHPERVRAVHQPRPKPPGRLRGCGGGRWSPWRWQETLRLDVRHLSHGARRHHRLRPLFRPSLRSAPPPPLSQAPSTCTPSSAAASYSRPSIQPRADHAPLLPSTPPGPALFAFFSCSRSCCCAVGGSAADEHRLSPSLPSAGMATKFYIVFFVQQCAMKPVYSSALGIIGPISISIFSALVNRLAQCCGALPLAPLPFGCLCLLLLPDLSSSFGGASWLSC